MLEKTGALLSEVAQIGLFTALEKGLFAQVKRPRDGGKGLEGVFTKGNQYCNPFMETMQAELEGGFFEND